jgi:hypothetical protein
MFEAKVMSVKSFTGWITFKKALLRSILALLRYPSEDRVLMLKNARVPPHSLTSPVSKRTPTSCVLKLPKLSVAVRPMVFLGSADCM